MNQKMLFSPEPPPVTKPRSHRTDADTAKAAAREMEENGRAAKHRTMVMIEVSKHPEQTAAEIGEATKLGHIEAQRRLSDLKRDGIVEQGVARKCTVKGSMMSVWRIAE